MNEESKTLPLRPGGEACLKAEQLIFDSELAVKLRCCGLPVFMALIGCRQSNGWRREIGKKLSSAGFLNLIHVDDGAKIVDQVAKAQPAGETYLVGDGNPVLRRDYYSYIAECLGLKQIPWSETDVDPKALAAVAINASRTKSWSSNSRSSLTIPTIERV